MTRSSMPRANLNYSDADSAGIERYDSVPESGFGTSSKVKFPNFDAYGGTATYAITARLAGRINAASVSSEEHRELLREREGLVNKAIRKEITRREANRLEYVRWSLDRIEDARYGHSLDALESLVEFYERFETDIQDLRSQLEAAKKRR